MSFESGEFASDWKEALLKPLLKKCGLDIAFNNFRPLSNLPYVSKLSEKAAANQLIDHMTTNDLYMPLQSAYKQNHSTESALHAQSQERYFVEYGGAKGHFVSSH